jgi:hypothetical protein
MSSTRNGPLAELVQTTADEVGIALSYSAAFVKRGAKGPVLLEWAERNRIVVPGALYETYRSVRMGSWRGSAQTS